MKRAIAPALLLLAIAVGSPSSALDLVTRPVGPVRTWQASQMAQCSSSWLEVKFIEGSDVRIEDGRFVDDSGLDLSRLRATLDSESILEMRSMLRQDRSTLRAWKQAGEERAGIIGPDLSLWFDLRVAGGRAAVARMVNALNDIPCVEISHPMPVPESLVHQETSGISNDLMDAGSSLAHGFRTTPDFAPQQGYLYDPPIGFGAPTAWGCAGGLGSGGKVIDLELFACIPSHEDLDPSRLFYEGGNMGPSSDHELAVLGEIAGQHNGFGVNGFAPDALYGIQDLEIDELAQPCQDIIDHLQFGDVWVVEVGINNLPIESIQSCYDVIWTGVHARGITCAEAAGNGHLDLDDPIYNRIFDRTFRDSGAILVGAGDPVDMDATYVSNFGSRIDVHGWGVRIVSAGYGDLYDGGSPETSYTATFCCTSGATGMVAGASVSLQGIARAALGSPLEPILLRSILHETGTPCQGPRQIGPRPNLVNAVPAILGLTGVEPSAGSSVVRLKAVPNPFRMKTEITITNLEGQASMDFFDAGGRMVRSLEALAGATGARTLAWDGRDETGRRLPSGMYFYRLAAGQGSRTGRLLIIR